MKRLSVLAILILFLLPVYAQKSEQYSSRIVFLGASNTNTKQWNNGSYVTKLADLGSPWNITININSGIDGVGAFSYAENPDGLEQQVLQYSPQYVFVMLGGNDYLDSYSTQEFQQNLNWILSYLGDYLSSEQVFVSNIIWSPFEDVFSDEAIEKYYQFQNIIKNQTKLFNFYFVDVYNSTAHHDEYYQPDWIHLNEQGHLVVARSIDNQIREKIEPTTSIEYTGTAPLSSIIGTEITEPSDIQSNSEGDKLLINPVSVLFTLVVIISFNTGRIPRA